MKKATNLKKQDKLIYEFDPNGEMVNIEFNGKCIGFGNEWDQNVKTYSVLKTLCELLKIKFEYNETDIQC